MGYLDLTNADVFALTRLRRVQAIAERRNILFGKYGPTQYGKRAIAEFIAGHSDENVRVRPKVSAAVIHRLWVAQKGVCYLCDEPMCGRRNKTPERRSVDHVVPLSRGGANHGNILLAHQRCNEGKADRPPTSDELAYLRAINAGIPPTPPSSSPEPPAHRPTSQDR